MCLLTVFVHSVLYISPQIAIQETDLLCTIMYGSYVRPGLLYSLTQSTDSSKDAYCICSYPMPWQGPNSGASYDIAKLCIGRMPITQVGLRT